MPTTLWRHRRTDTFRETFFAGASLKANRLIKYTESQIGRHCNDRSETINARWRTTGVNVTRQPSIIERFTLTEWNVSRRIEFNHADRRVVIDNVDPECD